MSGEVARRLRPRRRSGADGGTDRDGPILFVDVDGVISLFGFDASAGLPGPFHWVDGVAHCIPPGSGKLLATLSERFELVWATGWEEKANEYLPSILDLPWPELPYLTFDGRATFGSAHWKLEAIGEYADGRPLAWIDDHIDAECHAWAGARAAPTLLIETAPATGITAEHVDELLVWADGLPSSR
ncbi:MAG TPA: hypothetical protein VEX36_11085 [Thermoleophilaceae bacterium]|nr:hypothetical protein [Thermoleophilaceae bacterium]